MNGWRKASGCDTGSCVEVFSKSSFSIDNGTCVEVAFRKSSASGPWTDNCVEVGTCTCDEIKVRDSKDRGGPVLTFTRAEWDAFVAGVRNGEFD